MGLSILPALALSGLLTAQAPSAQSLNAPSHQASADIRSRASAAVIEKCLYGDNYSCVVVLKKDRAYLSPSATQCIQDLALRGMDDSHPIASPECRDFVLAR